MASAEPIDCCAPLAAPTLSDEEAEATARLFRALGDPGRVRIVNMLATSQGEMCGCDMTELGLAQPTVSHHLKTLHEAGLLERVQRGKRVCYSLDRDAVAKLSLVADLRASCC